MTLSLVPKILNAIDVILVVCKQFRVVNSIVLEIRKVIYTTNAIESVNMSLRKVTKSRGSFPNDESLMKLFYLALMNISKKWTMPLRDWKPALNRFTIQFEERMPPQSLTGVYTKFSTPFVGAL